jgi:hypothetical protein
METSELLAELKKKLERLQTLEEALEAAFKGTSSTSEKKKPRKKRDMSAEHRAKIGAATKARWAAKRKADTSK